jgi:hypothetical protein
VAIAIDTTGQLNGQLKEALPEEDSENREPVRRVLMLLGVGASLVGAVAGVGYPTAHADNKRLNDGVVSNVFMVQRQAGCTNELIISPQLQLAAQWHANDVLNNRNRNGDIGSDDPGLSDRAAAAGFRRRRRNGSHQSRVSDQRP